MSTFSFYIYLFFLISAVIASTDVETIESKDKPCWGPWSSFYAANRTCNDSWTTRTINNPTSTSSILTNQSPNSARHNVKVPRWLHWIPTSSPISTYTFLPRLSSTVDAVGTTISLHTTSTAITHFESQESSYTSAFPGCSKYNNTSASSISTFTAHPITTDTYVTSRSTVHPDSTNYRSNSTFITSVASSIYSTTKESLSATTTSITTTDLASTVDAVSTSSYRTSFTKQSSEITTQWPNTSVPSTSATSIVHPVTGSCSSPETTLTLTLTQTNTITLPSSTNSATSTQTLITITSIKTLTLQPSTSQTCTCAPNLSSGVDAISQRSSSTTTTTSTTTTDTSASTVSTYQTHTTSSLASSGAINVTSAIPQTQPTNATISTTRITSRIPITITISANSSMTTSPSPKSSGSGDNNSSTSHVTTTVTSYSVSSSSTVHPTGIDTTAVTTSQTTTTSLETTVMSSYDVYGTDEYSYEVYGTAYGYEAGYGVPRYDDKKKRSR